MEAQAELHLVAFKPVCEFDGSVYKLGMGISIYAGEMLVTADAGSPP
jgi:hypothetical protein